MPTIDVEIVADEQLAWEQVGDEVSKIEFDWPAKRPYSDRAEIRTRMISRVQQMLRRRCGAAPREYKIYRRNGVLVREDLHSHKITTLPPDAGEKLARVVLANRSLA